MSRLLAPDQTGSRFDSDLLRIDQMREGVNKNDDATRCGEMRQDSKAWTAPRAAPR